MKQSVNVRHTENFPMRLCICALNAMSFVAPSSLITENMRNSKFFVKKKILFEKLEQTLNKVQQ